MDYTVMDYDGNVFNVTEQEILNEINRDHSEEWQAYNADDNLQEALDFWTEWTLVTPL